MDTAYKRAYTEVIYILNTIDSRLKEKIPNGFLEFLNNNCDKTYIPFNLSLNNPNTLSQETKNILSLIYRSYLNERKNDSNIIKANPNKDNDTNINTENTNVIVENKSIVVQNKTNNILIKVYNFIKRIFKHGGNK